MDESTFAVHHIEFSIETIPCLSNGSSVGTKSAIFLIQELQHCNRSISLSLIPSIRNNGLQLELVSRKKNLLVINSQFETSRTPINKLNSPTHFNRRDSLVSIPGDNISTIQQSTSHIMSGARIAYNHLIMRFKTLEGDILNTMTFMLRFSLGDDRGAGGARAPV